MNDLNNYVNDRIENAVEQLTPGGVIRPVSPERLRTVLTQLAVYVRDDTANNVLLSLLTVQDIAEELGVSVRRVKAMARHRHERFGVGWQVPGTNQWLFRPDEVDVFRSDLRRKP